MSVFKAAGSGRKDACTSTQEGLRLIGLLQNFVVHQNEEIDALKERIKKLEEEKNALKLERDRDNRVKCQDIVTQTEGSCSCDRNYKSEVSTQPA